MTVKRLLVVGGVVVALAVPTGVAIAATTDPGPARNGPATGQQYGPGHGPMMGNGTQRGYGDPEDCPYYDSAEHQQWMKERQNLTPEQRQQHRQLMWSQRSAIGA